MCLVDRDAAFSARRLRADSLPVLGNVADAHSLIGIRTREFAAGRMRRRYQHPMPQPEAA